MLISWWPNSDPSTLAYLLGLLQTANACKLQYAPCDGGGLAVKIFALPGWDRLAMYPKDGHGEHGTYPAFTRVSHGKIVLTDKRANVGTSNWEWGYMYDTAGASFNTNHQPFLHTIQAAFDRDWNSSYAVDLRTFIDTQGLAACRGRSTQADIHPSDTQACEDVLRQLMKQ